MKYLIYLLLFLSGLTSCERQSTQAHTPPPPTVSVAHPIIDTVTEWDYFTGVLGAKEQVELHAQASGYLDQILFEEGGFVTAGDPLFIIDQRTYIATLKKAEGGLKQAEAELRRARSEKERAERLLTKNAMSEEEVEHRLATEAIAEANVQSAHATLEAAKLELEFTEIKAPFSGKISESLVDKGHLVNAGDTPLATIVATNPIYAYVHADERSLLKYRRLALQGNRFSTADAAVPVDIGLADEEGYSFTGVIDYIDPMIDASMGTGIARAIIDNPDDILAPGFFVRLRVIARTPYEAMLIPNSAIVRDQKEYFVYVLNEQNQAIRKSIKVGVLIEQNRVVNSGLQESDLVIVNGVQRVEPNSLVTPKILTDNDTKP